MKRKYSPLENYKIWLNEVVKYYNVTEEEIIGGDKKENSIIARQTFYWLCWKDKINLPRLSEHFGKDRTTIGGTMNHGWKHRQKDVENRIYEKISIEKNLSEKAAEAERRKRGFCSYVAISDRLFSLASPRR